MKNENIKIKGRWHIVLEGPNGEIKEDKWGDNLITTAGKEWLVQHLWYGVTAATNTMHYIAVGTDTTSAAVGDTALISEIDRHTGTASYSAGGVYSVIATFVAASATAGAITEYGLLNSNTNGTLFSRDIESVINKGEGDTLTVTTEITFG